MAKRRRFSKEFKHEAVQMATGARGILWPALGGSAHETGRASRHSSEEALAKNPQSEQLPSWGDESSGPKLCRSDAEHEMGDGYHVYPYGRRVVVSGRHVGFVLTPVGWMVDATPAKLRFGAPSCSDGAGATDDRPRKRGKTSI